MVKEQQAASWPGIPVLMFSVLLALATPALLARAIWLFNSPGDEPLGGVFLGAAVLSLLVTLGGFIGLFKVNPNEARVLQLFGHYVGSVREPGLRWANPFLTKRRVSLRVRNFDSQKVKVNDKAGNPIEIGAVVVWRVVDSAEALFVVDDYNDYVRVQSESALRNLATHHPYDAHNDTDMSLVGNTPEISAKLKAEVQDRLAQAGVEVVEARISHLAYAPEIAGAMLQRQQASAVVAAPGKIVEGAVGMVQMAIHMLSEQKVLELDEERKAAMVSNLLVVLCGDHHVQPVVNAGSLYH